MYEHLKRYPRQRYLKRAGEGWDKSDSLRDHEEGRSCSRCPAADRRGQGLVCLHVTLRHLTTHIIKAFLLAKGCRGCRPHFKLSVRSGHHHASICEMNHITTATAFHPCCWISLKGASATLHWRLLLESTLLCSWGHLSLHYRPSPQMQADSTAQEILVKAHMQSFSFYCLWNCGSVKEKKERNTRNVDSHKKKGYFFLITLSLFQPALRPQESVLCYLILTTLKKTVFWTQLLRLIHH